MSMSLDRDVAGSRRTCSFRETEEHSYSREPMSITQRIRPCLWFDSEAEEAARFYTSIFENSKIVNIARYGDAGREIHKRPPGSVMVVEFDLDGQRFTALNG